MWFLSPNQNTGGDGQPEPLAGHRRSALTCARIFDILVASPAHLFPGWLCQPSSVGRSTIHKLWMVDLSSGSFSWKSRRPRKPSAPTSCAGCGILLSLGEATAIELHRDRDSQGFGELKRDATDAGATAGRARKVIEQDIGRPVVSAQNYRKLKAPTDIAGTSTASRPAKISETPDEPTQLPLFLDPL